MKRVAFAQNGERKLTETCPCQSTPREEMRQDLSGEKNQLSPPTRALCTGAKRSAREDVVKKVEKDGGTHLVNESSGRSSKNLGLGL